MRRREFIRYPRFCDFKRRVLDIAYEDLKSMATNNIADFYFEWEKIYPANQRKAGEPEAIKFTLFSSETSELYLNNRANIELKRKSISFSFFISTFRSKPQFHLNSIFKHWSKIIFCVIEVIKEETNRITFCIDIIVINRIFRSKNWIP